MAVAAPSLPKPKRKRGDPELPWWGAGEAPHLLWPGVSLDLQAVWSTLRKRWESPDGAFYFDAEEANRACDFFPTYLTHHIGEFAGRKFDLLEYQQKLLTRPIFGWKKTRDGLRRFSKVFAFLPKGAGKSPWASGTGLYLMLCDNEPGSEVYALANDRKQARTVHDNAKFMVEDSPDLMDICQIFKDSIVNDDTRSTYQVLSSDAASAHGKRPHAIIFDEFHGQRDRDLYEAMKKSMAKRRQPVLLIITHAGDDDEGICVAPDTKVLTADLRWVRAGDVQAGDTLAGFDEHRPYNGKGEPFGHRAWRSAPVTSVATATLPSYELVFSDGKRVVCSEDHMWLVQTAGRRTEWRKTKDITETDSFTRVLDVWDADTSYEAGYMAGVLDSEGHLSATERAHMLCGFTQIPNALSERCQAFLTARGYRFGVYDTAATDAPRSTSQTMVTRKRDVLRMLGSVRPPRLLQRFAEIGWEHLRFKAFARPTVVSKTPIGDRLVVGIKTTTHTFVAEGLASHNCYEEYEYAKRVLSGSIEDETCLPVIFEAQTDDNWADPDLWRRVNPGHGITIRHEGIANEYREAENEPRKRNDFLRYHLNRWVNQAVSWIPVDWWDACAGAIPPDADMAKLPCAAGLDLSQKIDLTALVVAVRHRLSEDAPAVEAVAGDGVTLVKRSLNYRLTLIPFFWIPENTAAEREREDGVPYRLWAEQGLVTLTEGDVIDYDKVCSDIIDRIAPRFPRLKSAGIGYDPAFASDLRLRLEARGFTMTEVLQNYQHLSEPSYVFEGLVKAKRIAHGGNRVLRNHVENVAVKRDDAGRIKPVKPRKSSTKRIDGVVATIMAEKVLALTPDDHRSAFARSGGVTVTAAGVTR